MDPFLTSLANVHYLTNHDFVGLSEPKQNITTAWEAVNFLKV